jgi:hypothetical protein
MSRCASTTISPIRRRKFHRGFSRTRWVGSLDPRLRSIAPDGAKLADLETNSGHRERSGFAERAWRYATA